MNKRFLFLKKDIEDIIISFFDDLGILSDKILHKLLIFQ